MNWNVWLLFCCQALMNAVMAGQVVMASLVGRQLAVEQALVTLPMAVQMLGVMAGSIPAGIVFSRLGRRPGFWLGAGLSLLGSLSFALGVWDRNFLIYTLAAIPAGMGFRHLAASAFCRGRGGRPGIPAACHRIGNDRGGSRRGDRAEIVKRTNMLLPAHQFLATYLTLLGLPALCALVLIVVALPPASRRTLVALPLRDIVARPAFLTAVIAGMVGMGRMNLVMASTPLEMAMCGFGVNASADVIRAHSIAMFLPGFVTGRLIQRYGAHPIIMLGALLTLACVVVNVGFDLLLRHVHHRPDAAWRGWNGMFVGATALLATAHDANERVRVQATNDFIVFGTVAVTALLSGTIESSLGWTALNVAVLPGAGHRCCAGGMAPGQPCRPARGLGRMMLTDAAFLLLAAAALGTLLAVVQLQRPTRPPIPWVVGLLHGAIGTVGVVLTLLAPARRAPRRPAPVRSNKSPWSRWRWRFFSVCGFSGRALLRGRYRSGWWACTPCSRSPASCFLVLTLPRIEVARGGGPCSG